MLAAASLYRGGKRVGDAGSCYLSQSTRHGPGSRMGSSNHSFTGCRVQSTKRALRVTLRLHTTLHNESVWRKLGDVLSEAVVGLVAVVGRDAVERPLRRSASIERVQSKSSVEH